MIEHLAPRERQVFEAVCRLGQASAVDVAGVLEDPPSNSAIRAMLSRLEAKGYLCHTVVAHRFIYSPVTSQVETRTSALDHIVQTFFNGSPASAAMALLGRHDHTKADLDALEDMIEAARSRSLT